MAGNWIWSTWMWVTYFITMLFDLMMIIKPYSKDTIDTFHTFFASPSDDRMVSIARCMSCCSTSSRTFSIRDLFSWLLKNTISIICTVIFPFLAAHPFPQITWNKCIMGISCLPISALILCASWSWILIEIGFGESALKVVGNIYIWSVWANIMILFKTLTVQKICTWQQNMSHYEQYVLFEAWVSILLFNRKQEALSDLCVMNIWTVD